jgi:hypothetical protein
MQAAVRAERAEAQEHAGQQDPVATPLRPAPPAKPEAVDVTSPSVNGGADTVNGEHKRKGGVAAETRPTPEPVRAANGDRPTASDRVAMHEPMVDDDATEWPGNAVKPQLVNPPPAVPAQAGRGRQSQPVRRPVAKPGRRARGTRLAAFLVVAALVGGSLSVVAIKHFTRSPASDAALARHEAAVRDQAAAWVAQQVSRNITLSCDPVMCHALTAHGFPSRDLFVLGLTSPDPRSSDVVVETAAVQGLFGTSLASALAPAVLASFGSGPARITVRVVAKHGVASFQTALRVDLADRKSAGNALLNDDRIVVSPLAQQQLAAGRVDSRLLLAIASLATDQPIDIVQFGNTGPGADPGIPLRYADLAENDQAAHLNRPAYVRAMQTSLSKVDANFRPARTMTVDLADGQAVLRVEVTAPSPLGTFGTQGSP